jgi:superfamily II DNA or RNA helicase
MAWSPGDRIIVRGADWRVIRSTSFVDCEALDLAQENSAVSRTLLLPFDRPRSPSEPRLQVVSRKRWARGACATLRTSHPYGGLQFCPESIRLLPYQLEPALAVLRHGFLRVLIADDVGLGKTVEAGLIVREIAMRRRMSRALILTPAAVRRQWSRELATLFDIGAIDADAAWLRRVTREMPADVNPWSLPGVYLASMDFVKRPEALHPLEHVRWDLLVVDEAHSATPGTDRRAAVHALACRSRCVVLLSATPHSGSDEQFDALCATGVHDTQPPVLFFRRTRADALLEGPSPRSKLLGVRPTPDEIRMHRLLDDYTSRVWAESRDRNDPNAELVATLLRKRALSSATSLALSLRRRLELLARAPVGPAQLFLPLEDDGIEEDGAPDAVLGGGVLSDVKAERRMLTAVADQAERAAHDESKVRILKRLLRRVREPALVFTEYRDTAERLQRALAADGAQVLLLHGGLPGLERARVVAAFASGGSVLVATDAVSEGLNLQHACRLVVHFELPWAPGRLHQRCGRVHRIGQTRRVHELALVATDTCEQLVLVPLIGRALRSRRFARTPLVELVPESRVAAHILGGTPLAHPDTRSEPAHLQVIDLRDEAKHEAARLALQRRLKPHGANEAHRTVPIARTKPAWVGCGASLIVVLDVALRDAHGRFEQQPLILSIANRAMTWPRRHRRLRHEVRRRLSNLTPQLDAAVRHFMQGRVAQVSQVREAAMKRSMTRDAEMTRQLRSTARELVQSGLFDRRAMRAKQACDRDREVLLEEVHASAGNPPPEEDRVELTYEIRAVLLGRSW